MALSEIFTLTNLWPAGTILLLMLLSAFFSASETALTRVSRALMHRASQEGDKKATIINQLHQNSSNTIASLLLGNNLVNVLASTIATAALIARFGDRGIAIAGIGMTILILVFCEIIPKAYALQHSERVSMLIVLPLRFFMWLMAPFTWLLTKLVNKLLAASSPDNGPISQSQDRERMLRGVIDMHRDEDPDTKHEREMLNSVLDLDDMWVDQIMTHRGEVEMLDYDTSWENLLRTAANSHYSRIPIYRATKENIIGILHTRKLLAFAGTTKSGDVKPEEWHKLIKEPWFIPNYTSLLEQLHAFRNRHEHIAIVVDEYGALEGIVTLEDVLEEIVGEIEDENEAKRISLQLQADGSIIVAGRYSIREINRQLDWQLPSEDFTTVAGLLIDQTQTVPLEGERYSFFGYRFEILKKLRQQIVLLKVMPEINLHSQQV